MTQQTMTKEQILGNYYREHTDTETAIYEAMERYKEQEVAKEREKAKKLVESAKNVLLCERDVQLVSGILSLHILELKQSLTEYEKL